MTTPEALLGKLLREHRGRLSLQEVTQATGISPSTLSRIERGRTPDLRTFAALCRWLGVSADALLGLNGKVPPEPEGDRLAKIEARLKALECAAPPAGAAAGEDR